MEKNRPHYFIISRTVTHKLHNTASLFSIHVIKKENSDPFSFILFHNIALVNSFVKGFNVLPAYILLYH